MVCLLKGQIAYGSEKLVGKVKIVRNIKCKIEKEEIMVVEIANPKFFLQSTIAKAIISDFGGIYCHMAILAREFKKPCLVGTENATRLLKDGDWINVNFSTGEVNFENGNHPE